VWVAESKDHSGVKLGQSPPEPSFPNYDLDSTTCSRSSTTSKLGSGTYSCISNLMAAATIELAYIVFIGFIAYCMIQGSSLSTGRALCVLD